MQRSFVSKPAFQLSVPNALQSRFFRESEFLASRLGRVRRIFLGPRRSRRLSDSQCQWSRKGSAGGAAKVARVPAKIRPLRLETARRAVDSISLCRVKSRTLPK